MESGATTASASHPGPGLRASGRAQYSPPTDKMAIIAGQRGSGRGVGESDIRLLSPKSGFWRTRAGQEACPTSFARKYCHRTPYAKLKTTVTAAVPREGNRLANLCANHVLQAAGVCGRAARFQSPGRAWPFGFGVSRLIAGGRGFRKVAEHLAGISRQTPSRPRTFGSTE